MDDSRGDCAGPESSQSRSVKVASAEEPYNFERNGDEGLQHDHHSPEATADLTVTNNNDGGSLLTALKLNAGAVMLSAILLRKKFKMNRNEHAYLKMPRNCNPESSSSRLYSQTSLDEIDSAQFVTKENQSTIAVLGPPLGMAIGTVFAEIFSTGCSLGPSAPVDELDTVLKTAIIEALMPVLGNECITLADKISIAFRSTYKTIASVREMRSTGPHNVFHRSKKVSGGCSLLLSERGNAFTGEKNANLCQQKREMKETRTENQACITFEATPVTLHNQSILTKYQNNMEDDNMKLYVNTEEPSISFEASKSSQRTGFCYKNPSTVLTSSYIGDASQGDEQDSRPEGAMIVEQDLKDCHYGPGSSMTNQHIGKFAQSYGMSISENNSCQKVPNEKGEDYDYSYSSAYCDSMDDTPTCYMEDKASDMSCNSVKASDEIRKLIVHGGEGDCDGLLVERNWQENFLQIFEKLVQAQEHHNYIKSMELTQRIKHLSLGEQQILLSHQSNDLMKEKLVFNYDNANFKRSEALEQKLISAYGELSRTCADELVAGLSIMLLSLAYGVRKYSYALLSNLISTCQPTVKEPQQTSRFQINWLYDSLDSLTSHFRGFVCQATAAGRLVVGLAIAGFVAQALLKRSVAGSSQAMPATIIVIILGGFCGFVGKIAVDSLGGDGKHWLVMWEILCLLHAVAACYTPLVYRLLNGSPSGKLHISFIPPWLRRLVFHSTIVAVLPILAGQLPFVSFRVTAKSLCTSIIENILSPAIFYSMEVLGY